MMKKFLISLCALFFLSDISANAAELINLNLNESRYFNAHKVITRVAIANPNIADIHTLPSNREFLIVSKSAGITSMIVWTHDNRIHEYNIIVSPEDPGTALVIQNAINLPDVRVKMVNGRVLLTGSVENQYEHNYALQVARLYTGGNASNGHTGLNSGVDLEIDASTDSSDVGSNSNTTSGNANIIDLLQIRNMTKIRFEAQIIEISSDDAKELGLQHGTTASSPDGIYYVGESYTRDNAHTTFANNPFSWLAQHFSPINVRIQALISDGKAQVLSRPYITTVSGQEANIHIGGTVKVRSTADNVTPVDMDYGITLKVKPVVDGEGNIISSVYSEVSDYQYLNGDPGKIERKASAVISLKSNETFVIGGLFDSSSGKTVKKIPLLGDIPILGEFFKHTSNTKEKRELIILLTPEILTDVSTAQMSDEMFNYFSEDFQERENMNEVEFDF